MSREVDRRRRRTGMVTPEREARLRELAAEVSDGLPGAQRLEVATVDGTTGNPAAVVSRAAPAERGNYIQRALDHLQAAGPALGLETTQPTEYVVDPSEQRTSADAVTVHAQQRYKGIPIFQAAQTVRFDPEGRLEQTVGRAVTVARELEVAPRLSVEEAVLRAAEHISEPDRDEREATDPFGEPLQLPGVRLDGFIIRVTATFPDRPERPTVLAPGPFAEDIRASLSWFPLDVDDLRLGWLVLLTMPGYAAQYRVVVDAGGGEVLYCRQLVRTVAARGSVFPVDGTGTRRTSEFPRPVAEYGLPVPAGLPASFPDHWVDTDRTVGNSVNAHLGVDGPPVAGALQDGVVVFDPADAAGSEQLGVNLFYLNCSMHDFFYLLGFQEADGSFQRDNFGRGGAAADPVDARAHPGPVTGTANMFTPVDGSSPVMNMGLVQGTGRHTALDSSVVYHEFMHGVTNRLVGGPLNVDALDEPQSGGMGEGWGDYVACVINQTGVVGAWVVGRPGGIRGFPYDVGYPDDFSNLGRGRYTGVHAVGEIWCATLMEMTRRVGQPLAIQLVVDALKLSRANPSFLDMRDAILAALDGKLTAGQLDQAGHHAALVGIWTAFARFGMGPAADCVGATLLGIQADFQLPDLPVEPGPEPGPGPDPTTVTVAVEAAPDLPIPDDQPAGVSSSLAVADAGQVAGLAVAVEIGHPFVGDLLVRLVAPGGDQAVLHDRAGGDGDDLARTWTSQDTPVLAALAGQPSRGDWALAVADLEGRDVGTLHRWSLELTLIPDAPPPDEPPPDGLGLDDTPADATVPAPPEVELEVDELVVEALAAAGNGAGRAADRMRATVIFRVSGPRADELAASRSPYSVSVLAHLPATGETILLAAVTGRLEPGRREYRATVEAAAPPAGRYQLLGAVVLADHDLAARTVGPRLTVVP